MFKFCNLDFHGGKLATFLIIIKIGLYIRTQHINIKMNRLGEILKMKGIQQKWLAEKLGMTPVMVSLYTNNKRQPKLDTLIRISEILDVDLKELIQTKKK
jgi:putative transcriptional regulator